MNGLILVCVIALIGGFIIVFKYSKRICEQEHLLTAYESKIRHLEREKIFLTMENSQLHSKMQQGQKIVYVNKNGPIEIPKGTIDAVKLAMKISHPDNGGNNDDFIKYREVYMRLTKKSS